MRVSHGGHGGRMQHRIVDRAYLQLDAACVVKFLSQRDTVPREDGLAVGKTAREAESMIPEQRVFVERIRRGGKIEDATADTVIQAGDIVAVAGRRDVVTIWGMVLVMMMT